MFSKKIRENICITDVHSSGLCAIILIQDGEMKCLCMYLSFVLTCEHLVSY